jgi:hypothetical protein
MTCPTCQAAVDRWAFLGASGLSGIVCDACGARLEATYESRLRLTGGGLLLGVFSGRLASSFGVPLWLSLVVGAAALIGWFALRTEAILVLEPEKPRLTSLK